MNGILVVDKPVGLSSFDIVRRVRRLAGCRRVGHAGTLDPMASGILPVAIGQATRLIEYLMGGEKVYVATLRLGVTTDTQDAEGQVLETRAWDGVGPEAFAAAVAGMTGVIQQIPPMYSALKRDGVPLYRLARQGLEVEREARTVTIRSIEIERFAPPEAVLRVTCGKGTYIRSLCHDLGQELGCGAHMAGLRRVRNGRFDESASWSLEQLEQLVADGRPLPLLSPAEALSDWPGAEVGGAALGRLRNGVAPTADELVFAVPPAEGQMVRLLAGSELVAIARLEAEASSEGPGSFKIVKVFPQVTETG